MAREKFERIRWFVLAGLFAASIGYLLAVATTDPAHASTKSKANFIEARFDALTAAGHKLRYRIYTVRQSSCKALLAKLLADITMHFGKLEDVQTACVAIRDTALRLERAITARMNATTIPHPGVVPPD